MIIARQDHVEGLAGDQGAVIFHAGLHHPDHQIGPIAAGLFRRRDGGFDRGQESQIPGPRDLRGRVLRHRDQRNLQPRNLPDRHATQTRHGRAVFLRDVDRSPGVGRGRHLFQEVFGTEVELMVPRHGQIKGHEVGQIDGVLPLVETRQDRGRQHVPVKQIQGVRIGCPLGAGDGVQPREPAPVAIPGKVVDVANAKKCQRHGFRQRRRGGGQTEDGGKGCGMSNQAS